MYVKYVYTYHCIAFWFQIQTLLKMEMGPLNIPLLSISTDKALSVEDARTMVEDVFSFLLRAFLTMSCTKCNFLIARLLQCKCLAQDQVPAACSLPSTTGTFVKECTDKGPPHQMLSWLTLDEIFSKF